MDQLVTEKPVTLRQNAVVTKAVLRAADKLGIPARLLARILGVSEATISRLKNHGATLEQGSKPFELAVLLIRVFIALDSIVGGDERSARTWLTGRNTYFGQPPIETIQTVAGLVDAVAYLDHAFSGP